MQDIVTLNKGVMALTSRAITTNTTNTGVSIDLTGFNSAGFYIFSGTVTDGVFTLLIEDSDDNTNWTTVNNSNLNKTIASATFTAPDDNVCKSIGYIGSKRYVKLSLVSTSVTTGGTFVAVAFLGTPNFVPVSGN
jgi:hypothetical protein